MVFLGELNKKLQKCFYAYTSTSLTLYGESINMYISIEI